jgi:hypothetical protein
LKARQKYKIMANKPKNKLHAMKGSKKEIPLLTLAGFAEEIICSEG